MINLVHSNQNLVPYFKDKIEENNTRVIIDDYFYDNNKKLKKDIIINLAIDDYYNSQKLAFTPPSVDNLVLIKRSEKRYSLYLVELKDVAKLRRLCADNIKGKFQTTIEDFMSDRFKSEFLDPDYKLTDLNVWLVCNRFSFLQNPMEEEKYEKKVKNSLMEKILLIQPFRFKGKLQTIQLIHNEPEIC